MVGVPGKSKACHDCRKRRIKCDQERPECGQCRRSNRQCFGYQQGRQIIFVNNAPQPERDDQGNFVWQTYTGPSPSEAEAKATKRGARSTASRSASSSSSSSSSSSASSPRSQRSLSPSALSTSLAKTSYEEKTIANFWASYMPNESPATDAACQFTTFGWTNVAQKLYTTDPVMRVALLASATGFMGQQQESTQILNYSQQLHCQALRAMERALRRPIEAQAPSLLISIRMLLYYEVWFGSSEVVSPEQFKRWRTHAMGNAALLLQCNPLLYQRGDAHRVFKDSRLPQVISGIQFRKRVPLATPQWKTIPWSETAKTPIDLLIDIMLELPGVCEDFDQANACEDEAARKILFTKLFKTCWKLDQNLQHWAATSGLDALALADSKIASQDFESGNTTSEDFAKGHLVLLYWAACILLYDAIQSLPTRRAGTLPDRMDPGLYCRMMKEFIPCFSVPNSGSAFLSIAVFTIALALWYLGKEETGAPSEERIQLLRAFKSYQKKSVSGFLNSVVSFGLQRPPRPRPLLE